MTKPIDLPKLKADELSLGAGVQSSGRDLCLVHGCVLVTPQPEMEKKGGEWVRKPAGEPFCRVCLELRRYGA